MRHSFAGFRPTVFAALVTCGAAIACGGGGSSSDGVTAPPPASGPPVNASSTMLTVTNNKFTPAHDSLGVGATLTWTWSSCSGDEYGGSACASHSVQFDDGGPSSDVQSSGSFSRTFGSTGTYTYHCAVHGAAMAGTVIIK